MNSRRLAEEESPDSSYYEAQRREMLPFIPLSAKRFVELGCGAGVFGALLRIIRSDAHVIGIEIHAEAAIEARKRLNEVIEKPVDVALEAIPASTIDCVVCNDILEHLTDPWSALRQIRKILRPGGSVVSSIPNVRYFPVFRNYFLGGDWQYEKWGVLDRTHLRFFTSTSIERMFTEAGYKSIRIEGIFGQPLPWKAALLNRVLRGKMDDMKYERFACVALLDATANSGLPVQQMCADGSHVIEQ